LQPHQHLLFFGSAANVDVTPKLKMRRFLTLNVEKRK